ncbi:MAG: hypothetical protein ACPGSM_16675 [Thiolinea sp.]
MGILLTLIALLIVYMGVMMVWKPDSVMGMVKLYADETGLQVLASVGRILLGVALLVYAGQSQLPGVLTVLGWLAIFTGIVFLFLKQETFSDLIRSMINQYGDFARIAGAVVVAMGLLILYAVF